MVKTQLMCEERPFAGLTNDGLQFSGWRWQQAFLHQLRTKPVAVLQYTALVTKEYLPWIQTYLSGDTTGCLLFYRNRGRGYSGLGSPFSLFRALLYFRFGVWLRVSPQTAESPLLSRGTFLCGERVVLCSALVFFLVIKSTLPWPSSEGPTIIDVGSVCMHPDRHRVSTYAP